MPRTYHHGDLPTALRAAAVELLAERGPVGFSLREVARRAGVSHAAPAHHFGDSTGLLTSVAAEGFALLDDRLAERTRGIDDPATAIRELGKAYVDTALEHRGHYTVMITRGYTNPDNTELIESRTAAYRQLLTAVRRLREHRSSSFDVEATATLLWATVHGLTELAPPTPIDDLLDTFIDIVLHGITRD